MDHLDEPINMSFVRRRQNVIQNQQRIARCILFSKSEEDANAKRVEVGLTVVALRWNIVFRFKSAGYVEAASPEPDEEGVSAGLDADEPPRLSVL